MKVEGFKNLMTGKVGVATSGGIDSMCLLHYCLENNFGAEVFAINIDHGIRGEESKRDSAFVKKYCEENGIECLQFVVNTPELGVEENARRLRYEVFCKLIADGRVDKIFTAHHASDRAETLLLSLIRGAGVSGASAKMQGFEKIYRPFLNVSKQEIELYAEQRRVSYVVDSSNFDDRYSRNLLRNKVFPFLKEVNAQAEQNLAGFCDKMQALDDYLLKFAEKFVKIEKNCAKASIKIDDELMFYSAKLCGVDVNEKNIKQLCQLKTAENGKIVTLSNCFAAKEYECITFYTQAPEYRIVWKKCGNFRADPAPAVFKRFRTLYADRSKIPSEATIRALRDGDVFCKFDGIKKAANDYLQEKKIPLRLRKNLPVLAVNNEIFLIFGVEVSRKLAVTNSENCDNVIIREK